MQQRRVMHHRDGLADDHVGSDFLERLQVNGREPMEFWSMAGELGVVLQQVSSVGLLWLTWLSLQTLPTHDTENILARTVGVLTILLGTLRYMAAKIKPPSQSQSQDEVVAESDAYTWAIAMHSVGYLVGLAGIAPAIVNLTSTVSDTAMDRLAALGILGHLTFHDYGVSNGRQAPTAGLNWAIFSAVCMASRLPEAGHVMVLVLVATVLFAAWPPICRAVKDADKRWDLLMTATMAGGTVVLLTYRSTRVAGWFLGICVFLEVVCPLWMLWMQKYKWEIHGPWDEAVPKMNNKPLF